MNWYRLDITERELGCDPTGPPVLPGRKPKRAPNGNSRTSSTGSVWPAMGSNRMDERADVFRGALIEVGRPRLAAHARFAGDPPCVVFMDTPPLVGNAQRDALKAAELAGVLPCWACDPTLSP